jgi:hypothetical protein
MSIITRILPLAFFAASVVLPARPATAPPANEAVAYERLFPGWTFDPAVPTQASVLGVRPGARPIRHDELMRYVEAVAAASKRVKVTPMATTWEGRPLVVIAVSDEATIGSLTSFKAEHAKLMDPRGRSASDDAGAAEGAKAVAWMAYGIHGDELSSTDAAAALLYGLAAGEGEAARTIRRELVVLIDPCENPDGRDRFLAQLRSFAHAGPSADPEDLSHTAIWPWGRVNHYLFDMNRDWINLVQPESRRVAEIALWLPQLMVDAHEMGAGDTYLFSPARPPFNPFLPTSYLSWARRYASDQAKALDAKGFPYYRGEWADEFFPGYGSSWAMYQGAVGILYEMSGTDGTLVRKPAGDLRTYGQAVEHQVASSIANLTTLSGNRREAVVATIAARRDGINRGAAGPVRAFVFPATGDPDRLKTLAKILGEQGIDVYENDGIVKAGGLRNAATGETAALELPPGSVMVPMDQPAWALARTILDPHVPMEASFLKDERESIELGRGTRIYDTTGWSIPLEFGVPAYWSSKKLEGSWAPAGTAASPAARASTVDANTLGWVFDGGTDAAVLAVADLLGAGVTLRVAEKPFKVEGVAHGPGAILVRKGENGPEVDRAVASATSRGSVVVQRVATVLADEGADLGGNYFHPLVAPRVGVFTGPLVGSSDYGWIWHLLDTQVGWRFTAIDLANFSSIDLRRYNVLVLPAPGVSSAVFRAILGKDGLEALKQWVEGGGTLIGVGGGATFLADKDTALTKTRLRSQALDVAPPPVWSLSATDALRAGPLLAAGLAASELEPPPADDATSKGTAKAGNPAPPTARSPYDVAPVIGPGAKPFVEGVELGTPLSGRPVELDLWLKPALPPGRKEPKEDDRKRADERLRSFSPQGALLRIDLAKDDWMTWGLPPDLTAWVGADDALIAGSPARAVASFPGVDTIQRGGLLWPEAAARLARTAYTVRERLGRGQVILFLDHPVFRGWTLGTRRLFLNALLYGPGLGATPPAPW